AGRPAIAGRLAALGRHRVVRRRDRAGGADRALALVRLHRQPLGARGVRDGCVRVLSDADDGARSRRAPDPLGRRADRARRPRAGRALPSPRGKRALVATVIGMTEEKIRLGGMALANRVLVPAPNAWARAAPRR